MGLSLVLLLAARALAAADFFDADLVRFILLMRRSCSSAQQIFKKYKYE